MMRMYGSSNCERQSTTDTTAVRRCSLQASAESPDFLDLPASNPGKGRRRGVLVGDTNGWVGGDNYVTHSPLSLRHQATIADTDPAGERHLLLALRAFP